jgi:MOSC domain-containing protein YiiM
LDLSFRFDLWRRALPQSPRDLGRVEGLVVRPLGGGQGARSIEREIQVSVEQGVVGDAWAAHPQRREGNQISLMNVHVLRSLCAADPERMALSGDNLQVDLELSEANLPPGTRLAVGEALLEVSAEPHRPCRSFHDRYGATGVKKVARANKTGHRGRGVLCRVLEPGTIRIGDSIHVQRPSP